MTLNKNTQKWVDALRSGEYAQARSRLRIVEESCEGYCCLGVACDVYHKETGNGHWDGSHFVIDKDDRNPAFLPFAVQEWLEIPDAALQFRLVGLNDSGTPFDAIATEIEAWYE